MTGTTIPAATAAGTWGEVIALLVAAADRGYQDSTADPAVHSAAVAAHGLAASAIALLPAELEGLLDEVVLEPTTASMSLVELIRTAETTAGHHPIESLPPGASELIVSLRDLIRQTTP